MTSSPVGARPGERLVFVVWAHTSEEPFIAVCDTEATAWSEAEIAADDLNISLDDFHVEMLQVLNWSDRF